LAYFQKKKNNITQNMTKKTENRTLIFYHKGFMKKDLSDAAIPIAAAILIASAVLIAASVLYLLRPLYYL
jgi:hypothetical protein